MAVALVLLTGTVLWHSGVKQVHPEAGGELNSPHATATLPGLELNALTALGLLAGSSGNGSQSAQAATNLAAGGNTIHSNIVTTFFWVGEPADSDNGYIANAASAWDGHWQVHYGGVDSPTGRNGSLPGAFTPLENPFYIALPYNDFSPQSTRKANATSCLSYTPIRNDHYSWCKNIWVAVAHGNKTAYAQWEDVGPFLEDDSTYVFGTAPPHNSQEAKAGLDVSPAVRDYLGLGDVDHTSWWFVPASAVPDGPWKVHSTTSLGDSL
ncbi:MAG TPA: hypothetical protein VLE99_01045 [Candidatus Saccharimonadales bacterium]|nr:hypothetical protein [Candidatus Saccharimonadales bacterium]